MRILVSAQCNVSEQNKVRPCWLTFTIYVPNIISIFSFLFIYLFILKSKKKKKERRHGVAHRRRHGTAQIDTHLNRRWLFDQRQK